MAVSSSVSRRAFAAFLSLAATAQPSALPFQLTAAQLPRVTVTLSASSTKPNARPESITLSGTGQVTLRAGEEVRTGKLPPAAVTRLLELLRRQGVESWDALYSASASHFAARVLIVERDGKILKQVEVRRAEFPEFARAAGAIAILAAQACPEAANGSFLQLF